MSLYFRDNAISLSILCATCKRVQQNNAVHHQAVQMIHKKQVHQRRGLTLFLLNSVFQKVITRKKFGEKKVMNIDSTFVNVVQKEQQLHISMVRPFLVNIRNCRTV